MDIGIEIFDAYVVALDDILKCRYALPSFVIVTFPLLVICTIAIDVHISILATITRTVNVDCAIHIPAIAEGTVGAAYSRYEAALEIVGAFSRL